MFTLKMNKRITNQKAKNSSVMEIITVYNEKIIKTLYLKLNSTAKLLCTELMSYDCKQHHRFAQNFKLNILLLTQASAN